MKIYCFVELPSGFIDEYQFENYEEFCKFQEKNPEIKYGKPRFDTKFELSNEEN